MPEALIPFPHILHTLGREKVQAGGEHDDKHETQPKGGHGIQGIGDGRKEVVNERAIPAGTEDAQSSADDQCQDTVHKSQQQGGGKAFLNHVSYRAVVNDRVSEISPQHIF